MKGALLTIAGTDPSGGAGIPVDLNVFRDFGFHGCSVVTAVLAQNTQGVEQFEAVDDRLLDDQLSAVFSDIDIAGIKIGMLPNITAIEVVGEQLAAYRDVPVVLDPVFAAGGNGKPLREEATGRSLRKSLAESVDLVTPNVLELAALTGESIHTLRELKVAATELNDDWATDVLAKGGHIQTEGDSIVDIFASEGKVSTLEKLPSVSDDVRGTGCQLSSAIAAISAAEAKVTKEGIERARRYLNEKLRKQSVRVGGGRPIVVRAGETDGGR
jgi:hydroxymethylpyrimidine kinase/phosphomethylpyrimidine kinase